MNYHYHRHCSQPATHHRLRSGFALLLALLLWRCEHDLPAPIVPAPDNVPFETQMMTVPEACASCHPEHYNEWLGSMHAYAAVDPAFLSMQKMGQTETAGQVDQFCVQCHSPIMSKMGLTPPFYENDGLPPVGIRGVSCLACHKIARIIETRNAAFEFDTGPAVLGPIEDPTANRYHASAYSALHQSSELCGACHNVVNPRGVVIENTFGEWQRSPAAANGLQCQDCHMPVYRGAAAIGGPERDVHRHFFVGADVALIDFPDRERQLALVEALLRSAAELRVEVPAQVEVGQFLPIAVTITSKTAGHHLPTGAVADRQMWLSVTVTEQASGRIIYQSGHLDANGDLLDRHSEISPNADFDLVVFAQQMTGNEGQDVFFSWQAYHERTVTLPPLASVTPAFRAYVPEDLSGPLRLEVKLRFRSFPPFLLRKIGLPDIAAQLPIVDMATWSGEIAVL